MNPRELFLKLSEFTDFLADQFNIAVAELQQIIDIIGGAVVTPINAGIQAVKDWWVGIQTQIPALGTAISAADSFIKSVVAAIISGIRGIPFVGGSIANFLSELTGTVQKQQVQQQNFTISALANGTRNPSHQCRYAIGDVTFPESMFVQWQVFNTSNANVGQANTAQWSTQPGQGWGGYITTTNTTAYDTVGCCIVKTTATTISNIFLEVFREGDDGSLAQLFTKDISAFIPLDGTGSTYTEYAIPGGIVAMAGERYMVRVRNAGAVNMPVAFIGTVPLRGALDIGSKTLTASVTNKSSYTAAEAATALADGSTIPWALLAAKNPEEPEVSYSDDFNRQFLGPDWRTDGLAIDNFQLAYGGATNGEQSGYYLRRTTRDDSIVSGNIYVGSTATTQRSAFRLHCDREGTQSVEISATATDCKIYSYVNGTKTQRATVSTGGTDLYSLYYDIVNDKYVGLKGGVPFGLQWTSVGSAVSHGARYRFGGMRIERASGINSGQIDNFNLTDYAG
ncbi:hypothetical protein [Mycobacterium sp. URHB0021]